MVNKLNQYLKTGIGLFLVTLCSLVSKAGATVNPSVADVDAFAVQESTDQTPQLIANVRPVISGAASLGLTLPSSLTLSYDVFEDGLPSGNLLTEFVMAVGPAPIVFNPTVINKVTATQYHVVSGASFSQPGTYVIFLKVWDDFKAPPVVKDITIFVDGDAGDFFALQGPSTQSVQLPDSLPLNYVLIDHGLSAQKIIVRWSPISGPGSVTTSSPTLNLITAKPDTYNFLSTATFSAPGSYVLEAGVASNINGPWTTKLVTITVLPPAAINKLPTIIGPTQYETKVNNQLALNYIVTDDGLPVGGVTAEWSHLTGPALTSFQPIVIQSVQPNRYQVITVATFSAAGLYALRLSAKDSDHGTAVISDVLVIVKEDGIVSAPITGDSGFLDFKNRVNPDRENMNIKFQVGTNGQVDITIYDHVGDKARSLVNDSYTVGNYTATWDGKNSKGDTVGTGMYVVFLKIDGTLYKKKVLIER